MSRRFARIAVVLSSAGVVLSSCGKDQADITNYISVSPDRRNAVHVETTDYGGPGTAAIITSAELEVPDGKPIQLLRLEHQMLSTAGVNTVWSSPSEIDIYYYGGKPYGAQVDYFKPAVGGFHIKLHNTSSDAGGNDRSGVN